MNSEGNTGTQNTSKTFTAHKSILSSGLKMWVMWLHGAVPPSLTLHRRRNTICVKSCGICEEATGDDRGNTETDAGVPYIFETRGVSPATAQGGGLHDGSIHAGKCSRIGGSSQEGPNKLLGAVRRKAGGNCILGHGSWKIRLELALEHVEVDGCANGASHLANAKSQSYAGRNGGIRCGYDGDSRGRNDDTSHSQATEDTQDNSPGWRFWGDGRKGSAERGCMKAQSRSAPEQILGKNIATYS